jgi:hypothetical protein
MPEQTSQRWWNRILRPSIDVDADRLQAEVVDLGASPISECTIGQPFTVHGLLKSVTLRPAEGTPVVEADLWDGTAQINLVFLGRRRIPGITPGRHLVAHGRPIIRNGQLTMMNPRYELLAAHAD